MTLRPDFYLGVLELISAAVGAGIPHRAAPFVATGARLRPSHFLLNLRAVEALTSWTPNLDGARDAARRALKSVDDSADPTQAAFVRFFPAFEAWSRGEVRAASLRAEEAFSAMTRVSSPASHQAASCFAVMFALTVGRLGEARALIERLPEAGPMPRAPMIAWWAHERGDFDTAQAALVGHFRETGFSGMGGNVTAWLFARVDGVSASTGEGRRPLPTHQGFVAERALRAGRPEEAIAPFKDLIGRTEGTGHVLMFLASESLARAFEQTGRRDEAIHALEHAGRQQLKTYPLVWPTAFTGFAWIRTQAALVGLYHDAGREADEVRLRTRLLGLLVDADADHPIRRELEGAAAAHRTAGQTAKRE